MQMLIEAETEAGEAHATTAIAEIGRETERETGCGVETGAGAGARLSGDVSTSMHVFISDLMSSYLAM